MTTTLQAIDARQAELIRGTTLELAGLVIELAPGERYAGTVLADDGTVKHHLVLMPGSAALLDWPAAMAWARTIGGTLPTRQEQALLLANCKGHLAPLWHWSSDPAGESHAWSCSFLNGHQACNYRAVYHSVVAVRRFLP